MAAIMFNTKYDPMKKYRHASGSIGAGAGIPDTEESVASLKGTPADNDYLNRYQGVADQVANGQLPSGYYHYIHYGINEGKTYNFALNDTAGGGATAGIANKVKSNWKKYLIWAVVLGAAGYAVWHYRGKLKKIVS